MGAPMGQQQIQQVAAQQVKQAEKNVQITEVTNDTLQSNSNRTELLAKGLSDKFGLDLNKVQEYLKGLEILK